MGGSAERGNGRWLYNETRVGGEGFRAADGDWRRAQQESRSWMDEAFGHADVPQNCCGSTSIRDEKVMGGEVKCGGEHSLSRRGCAGFGRAAVGVPNMRWTAHRP